MTKLYLIIFLLLFSKSLLAQVDFYATVSAGAIVKPFLASEVVADVKETFHINPAFKKGIGIGLKLNDFFTTEIAYSSYTFSGVGGLGYISPSHSLTIPLSYSYEASFLELNLGFQFRSLKISLSNSMKFIKNAKYQTQISAITDNQLLMKGYHFSPFIGIDLLQRQRVIVELSASPLTISEFGSETPQRQVELTLIYKLM